MTLEEQLAQLRAQARENLPPEVFEGFQQATADLVARGIEENVLSPGSPAPDFELPNATGTPVRLSNLLQRGPAVVSFYRGNW